MNASYDRNAAMSGLRRLLPYVRMFKGRIFVVKIGGALCGDEPALREVIEQLAVLHELGMRVVLVHGGGPQTTALADKLGLETTMVDGRRVTSGETLDVAVMTLNGAINTSILAACRKADLQAVGLSGVDAGLIRATKRPPQVKEVEGKMTSVDYGLVGDIVGIDGTLITKVLDAGMVPVVSPLGCDDEGQVLNINADTVASTLARELGAEKLIFVTDTAGLLSDKQDPTSLVSYTDVGGIARLIAEGAIAAGMLPKVKAATEALEGGVGRVHMVGYRTREGLLLEIFTNEGAGTLIVRAISELSPKEQDAGAEAA